ncbi:alcohol dehydrogenase [Halarchaeum acidiphilum MH1-52-1]|uniref:Alcohol dehydrogenase n=1 Tax=Halarchaeum acidiphilum MH1-52-1 TaxID=1261545 RepID=U2YUJ5_9EURY|nr:alcohol dehydrogenase catalytic domain-containing protein [Halarchaeum acidiphilum]GAD52417.1 alcohol dehydrogenase [Halarchaeum acidiphilum MH1-52-1]
MPTNTTGRLAYLADERDVEIREYPVPDPEPGALVTEVVRANVCGSELHIWNGEHPLLDRMVLGHEALCRVSDLGDGVETDYDGEPIEEGDLVAPTYFVACGKCAACGRGEFRSCENDLSHWVKHPDEFPHFHGTFATHYYIHPEQHFYKVPANIPEASPPPRTARSRRCSSDSKKWVSPTARPS